MATRFVLTPWCRILSDVADASARAQDYLETYWADPYAHGFVAMRLKWADEMKRPRAKGVAKALPGIPWRSLALAAILKLNN